MALLLTDPVCFRRDENGDVLFPLELASGLEAAAIGVDARFRLVKGEFFANRDVGVPWLENEFVSKYEAILGQAYDQQRVRTALRGVALTTPGVVDVPELDVSLDASNRELSVTFVARTAFGDTPAETTELEF